MQRDHFTHYHVDNFLVQIPFTFPILKIGDLFKEIKFSTT